MVYIGYTDGESDRFVVNEGDLISDLQRWVELELIDGQARFVKEVGKNCWHNVSSIERFEIKDTES